MLYTHEHADHIFGLDDLRMMQFYLGGPVPLYCEATVEERIRKSFDYAFSSTRQPASAVRCRSLQFHRIGLEPFEVLGARVVPIRMQHGPRFEVLGFRFGNVAYCTDANSIPPESMELLDGPRRADARRAAAHAGMRRTSAWKKPSKSPASSRRGKRTSRTCRTSWNTKRRTPALPPGMALAYDGLRIDCLPSDKRTKPAGDRCGLRVYVRAN